jgi:hypothetical protein
VIHVLVDFQPLRREIEFTVWPARARHLNPSPWLTSAATAAAHYSSTAARSGATTLPRSRPTGCPMKRQCAPCVVGWSAPLRFGGRRRSTGMVVAHRRRRHGRCAQFVMMGQGHEMGRFIVALVVLMHFGPTATAEQACVKFHQCISLDEFKCHPITRRTAIRRVCYSEPKQYMVLWFKRRDGVDSEPYHDCVLGGTPGDYRLREPPGRLGG